MKFLFGKRCENGSAALFWLWNLGVLLVAAVGLSMVAVILGNSDAKTVILGLVADPRLLLLNVAPVALVMLVLYYLTGWAHLAYGVTGIATLGLATAHFFKMQFRNDPLLLSDLALAGEAGDMATQYPLFWTVELVAALAVLIVGWVFCFFLVRGKPRGAHRFLGLSLSLCLCLPLGEAILDVDAYKADGIANWNPVGAYLQKGFVYPLLHTAVDLIETPPEGYDPQLAADLLANYPDTDIPADKKVNLITVMLESYNDFQKYPQLQFNPEVYAVLNQLSQEGVRGNLITNTFGGGTVNTERGYLTGYLNLPSFDQNTNAYPWYFRDQGYYAEGAHGGYDWYYKRNIINQSLGYNNYYFVDNYFHPQTNWEVAMDDVFMPGIIDLWEARPEGQPYFAYHLTYQGHGPYSTTETRFGDDNIVNQGYSPELLNLLNNYFGSIRDTNAHLGDLVDYFRQEEEPVVLVFFGDHNPTLGEFNSGYDTLGIDLDWSASAQGFYNYYTTPYVIWANEAAKETLGRDFSGTGPDLSPNFLMQEVFEQCGWPGTASMQANAQLKEWVPIINTNVDYFVENGELSAQLSPEGEALLSDFNIMEYALRHAFGYGELMTND